MIRQVTGQSGGYAVTLDIGGSHVTAAALDLQTGTIAGEWLRQDLPHTAPAEALLEVWARLALTAAQAWPVGHIGLAVPGPFDLAAGISRMEHKFSAIQNLELRPLLAAHFAGTPLENVPLHFGNDADMFALGEWWQGAGRGSGRMIGITLGTGLGSGFVAQGRLVSSGPEVPPGGELWNVPFREASAEAFANGAALSRLAETHTGTALSAKALAQRTDAASQQIFDLYGQQLAEILAPWATRFAAERLVLGGNVSRAFDRFGPALQSGLPAGCVALPSQHFELAALYGAAQLGGNSSGPKVSRA